MSPQNQSQYAEPELELEPELDEPRLYQVVLINDDYTTMEFVIEVLQRFFQKSYGQAERLMYQIHDEGSAVAGIYPREIAETRCAQVINYARKHDYPLMCTMRPH